MGEAMIYNSNSMEGNAYAHRAARGVSTISRTEDPQRDDFRLFILGGLCWSCVDDDDFSRVVAADSKERSMGCKFVAAAVVRGLRRNCGVLSPLNVDCCSSKKSIVGRSTDDGRAVGETGSSNLGFFRKWNGGVNSESICWYSGVMVLCESFILKEEERRLSTREVGVVCWF